MERVFLSLLYQCEAENVYAPQMLKSATLYLDMPKYYQKSGPE